MANQDDFVAGYGDYLKQQEQADRDFIAGFGEYQKSGALPQPSQPGFVERLGNAIPGTDRLGTKLVNTAGAIGGATMEGLGPTQMLGHLARTLESGKPSESVNVLDTWRENADRQVQNYANAPDANEPTLFGVNKGQLREEIAPNVAQAIPLAVGTLASGPVALGASALGLAGMYNESQTQAATAKAAADEARLGRPLTLGEKQAMESQLEPDFQKMGAAELIPEIGGTLVDLAATRGLGPFAGAVKPLASAFGKEALTEGLKRFGIAGATTALSEVPEEIATGMMQQPIESRLGMTPDAPRDFTNPADWMKTAEEVTGPTLRGMLPFALLGGGAGGYNAIQQGRQAYQRNLDTAVNPQMPEGYQPPIDPQQPPLIDRLGTGRDVPPTSPVGMTLEEEATVQNPLTVEPPNWQGQPPTSTATDSATLTGLGSQFNPTFTLNPNQPVLGDVLAGATNESPETPVAPGTDRVGSAGPQATAVDPVAAGGPDASNEPGDGLLSSTGQFGTGKGLATDPAPATPPGGNVAGSPGAAGGQPNRDGVDTRTGTVDDAQNTGLVGEKTQVAQLGNTRGDLDATEGVPAVPPMAAEANQDGVAAIDAEGQAKTQTQVEEQPPARGREDVTGTSEQTIQPTEELTNDEPQQLSRQPEPADARQDEAQAQAEEVNPLERARREWIDGERQTNPNFAPDINSRKELLSPQQAEEVNRLEELRHKSTALQGPEQGYKPYKLTQAEIKERDALNEKYRDLFYGKGDTYTPPTDETQPPATQADQSPDTGTPAAPPLSAADQLESGPSTLDAPAETAPAESVSAAPVIEDLPENRFRVTGIDPKAAQQAIIEANKGLPEGKKLPTGNAREGGLVFNNQVRDKVLSVLAPETANAPSAERNPGSDAAISPIGAGAVAGGEQRPAGLSGGPASGLPGGAATEPGGQPGQPAGIESVGALAPTEQDLTDTGLLRQWGDRWQYKTGGSWKYANSREGAIESASEAWNKTPPEQRLTREQRDTQANDALYADMDARYGQKSLPELEAELGRMDTQIAGLQRTDEITGQGTRRTGAAVSNEGARQIGEEKLKLGAYLDMRREREANAPTSAPGEAPTLNVAQRGQFNGANNVRRQLGKPLLTEAEWLAGQKPETTAPASTTAPTAETGQTAATAAQAIPDQQPAEQTSAPHFETYDDAQTWIKERAKALGVSPKAFSSTDEYKSVYPQVDALYQTEKAKNGVKRMGLLKKAGVKVGDKVKTTVVNGFMGAEEYTGTVVMKGGIPKVKIDGRMTVSSKGRLRDTSEIAWDARWQKAETAPTASVYDDPRMKRPIYRNAIKSYARELTPGGDISYIRDENDRIVGRTASINPQWFQNLPKEAKMSVKDAQKAIAKADAGEKLGAREQRLIRAILDEIQGERTTQRELDHARNKLEAQRERQRQEREAAQAVRETLGLDDNESVNLGYEHLEDDYDADADHDSRIIADLAEQYRNTPDADENWLDNLLAKDAPDAEIAKQLQERINGRSEQEGAGDDTQVAGEAADQAGAELFGGLSAAERPTAERLALQEREQELARRRDASQAPRGGGLFDQDNRQDDIFSEPTETLAPRTRAEQMRASRSAPASEPQASAEPTAPQNNQQFYAGLRDILSYESKTTTRYWDDGKVVKITAANATPEQLQKAFEYAKANRQFIKGHAMVIRAPAMGSSAVISGANGFMPDSTMEEGIQRRYEQDDADVPRFSRTKDQPRDLIFTHNLTADNLLHAAKMGGLPVPSLAVTKRDTPMSGFGEITLIGTPEMADPKGYAKTKVYGADIYSPRYPDITYEVKPQAKSAFEKKLDEAIKATDNWVQWGDVESDGSRGLEKSPPVMWQFLKDQGMTPNVPMVAEKELSPELRSFAEDARYDYELVEDKAFQKAVLDGYAAMYRKVFRESGDSMAEVRRKTQERIGGMRDGSDPDALKRLAQASVRELRDYQRSVRESRKVDAQAVRRALQEQIAEAKLNRAYADYAKDMLASIPHKERIFQGYTNSGNRRYIDHTLENVVKILKKNLRGGESFNYGLGSVRAKFTPEMKSINQIRENKNRLVDKATFEQVEKDLDAEFNSLGDRLGQYHRYGNSVDFTEIVGNTLSDAATMGLPRSLAANQFKDVPTDLQAELAGFLNTLRNLPTEYFEAKILRDVSLSEFTGAVVPDNADPRVLKVLKDAGITDIQQYKQGDEADRTRAIQGFERAMFLFGGEKASTSDTMALSTAKQRLDAGENAETVRRETGWFRGVDGAWRFEISDEDAKFLEPNGEDITYTKVGDTYFLSDILDHPKLFAAYPDLARMQVDFVALNDDFSGIYYPGNDTIGLVIRDKDSMLSTLMHEVQHAIQRREGFARGGNYNEEFADSVKNAIHSMANAAQMNVNRWKSQNIQQIMTAEDASEKARYALMYESAQRLIGYANRDKPSGVFRLIRNELQWMYQSDFQGNDDANQVQRDFWSVPKSGDKRNQFLSSMAFRGAQVLLNRIPERLRQQFKGDERTVKAMVAALQREANKANKALKPLSALEDETRRAHHVLDAHKYSGAFDIYRSMAGEVEARNTQARLKMTEAERQSVAPKFTADVSPENIIVMVGGLDIQAPSFAGSKSPGRASQQEVSPALSRDAVQATADRIRAKLRISRAVGLKAVESEAELPKEILAQAKAEGATGEIIAVHHKGVIYLVADKHRTDAQIEESILHEATHYGADALFGRAKDAAYSRLFTTMGREEGLRQYADKLGIRMDSYFATAKRMTEAGEITEAQGSSYLVDEFLAHAEGSKAYDTLPQKIKTAIKEFYGAIRNWLRTQGFVELAQFTDADLAYLLRGIRRATQGKIASGDAKPMFMVAWHGSPHDHNKFSSDKIGTGEGAQAFGYGHYFTNAKDIAEYYKEKLSLFTYNGRTINASRQERFRSAVYQLWAAEGDKDQAKRADRSVSDIIDRLDYDKIGHKGKLYQVELAPAEDEYLDWHKPLSEQSAKVREALAEQIPEHKIDKAGYLRLNGMMIEGDNGPELSGRDAYMLLKMDNGGGKAGEKAASEYLHSLGIRGIRYPAEGQTGGKSGDRMNFVVFSDDDVSITAKFSRAQTINVDGTERPRTNSEGRPIHPTEEGLRNFWRWFGSSRVIDDQGRPLMVNHGTKSDFSVFDLEKAGSNNDTGMWGTGFYFSPSERMSLAYGDKLMQGYLSLKNPLIVKGGMSSIPQEFRPSGLVSTHGEAGKKASDEMRRRLMKAGYDGVMHYERGDNGLKLGQVVAFEPTQIKSATDNNGDFSPTNPDIRFSRASGHWNTPVDSAMDNLIRKLQNKHIDTKRVVEAIKEARGTIEDRFDPELKIDLYDGRVANRLNEFLLNEVEPFYKALGQSGVSVEELEKYLHARHAEERNEQMAKVNKAFPDGGSGMTNQEAWDYLASVPNRAVLDRLAAQVDAINTGTKRLLVDEGLETQGTIETWDSVYQHYVPLFREEAEGEQRFGNGTGPGFSVRGPASKRAMGSTRNVVDILANSVMARERALTRAEKNRVSTALFGAAAQNPADDFWRAVDPDKSAKEDMQDWLEEQGLDDVEIEDLWREPRKRVIDKRTGQVTYRLSIPDRFKDNVVALRIDGKDKFIFFNQNNPRALEMARALKNLDTHGLGTILTGMRYVTRWVSSVNTQFNPIFGITNIIRDTGAGLLNLESTPLKGQQLAVLKEVPSALMGIYRDVRADRKGKARSSGAYSRLFEEYEAAGGETGYRDMFRTSQDRADALQKIIDPSAWADSKWGKLFTANGTLKVPLEMARRAAQPLFDWLSDYNRTLENAVRLAAYKVGKDNDLGIERSAQLAKNLTVNFNKKGQIAQQMGAMYAFFNASMQGSARIAETLLDKRGTLSDSGKKIVAGGMLLGVAQALMLAGYDDDEPPEFVREKNFIIPLPDGKYASFPYPLGFHILPNTGRVLTDIVMRGKPGDRVASLLGSFIDAFNPIGSAGMSMQTLTPTAFDPMAALAENKDWTGKPIAKENFSSLSPTPGFTRAKDTASWFGKVIAEMANTLSGGTDYVPGAFSPTPDQIDFLIGQATGGVGRELMKAQQLGTSLVTGEEIPPYKVPGLGRFFGSVNSQAAESSRFYDNLTHLNMVENTIRGMRKDGKNVGEYLRETPEARLVKLSNTIETDIRELRARKRALVEKNAPKMQVQMIENAITTKMKRLNEAMQRINP